MTTRTRGIFGKNAVNDVYPLMLEHLETTQ